MHMLYFIYFRLYIHPYIQNNFVVDSTIKDINKRFPELTAATVLSILQLADLHASFKA